MKFNGVLLGTKLDAVFDTGTTYMLMSQKLYDRVQAILEEDGCTSPTLTLIINGQELTIPKGVLLTNSGCNLRSGVVASTGEGRELLVGATFLVNFYSVFDLTNDRMGFCPAKRRNAFSRHLQDTDDSETLSRLLDDPERCRR